MKGGRTRGKSRRHVQRKTVNKKRTRKYGGAGNNGNNRNISIQNLSKAQIVGLSEKNVKYLANKYLAEFIELNNYFYSIQNNNNAPYGTRENDRNKAVDFFIEKYPMMKENAEKYVDFFIEHQGEVQNEIGNSRNL